MKYVKKSLISIALPALLLTVGCTTTSKTSQQQDKPIATYIAHEESRRLSQGEDETQIKEAPAKLIESSKYLPEQSYDVLGEKVPYESAPNPYLEVTESISGLDVKDFIKARRAFKAGDLKQADKMLTSLSLKSSKLSGPYVMKAKIALLTSDLGKAEFFYKEAIRVNPINVNSYIGLAKLQREMGEYKRAQNTYVQALSIWKDFPEAHANLAILYDIYLNIPLAAQQHMEAYHFLTQGSDKNSAQWLSEIQQRTGIYTSFVENPPATMNVVSSPSNLKKQLEDNHGGGDA